MAVTITGENALPSRDALTIARIVKVNHAGEFGAIRIYSAQIIVARCLWPDVVPTLAEMLDVRSAADAGTDFQRAIFAIPGVVSLFGVNDFVTVTREPSAEWDPIIAGVVEAAAAYL